MQEVVIINQLDWLKNNACTLGRGHCLPAGFDSYLKLLLPIGIDHSISLAEYSPRRGTVAEMNARAAFWRKYDIGGPSASDDKLTSVKYSELAEIWNVPYNKDFTPDKIAKACGEWPPNLRESNKLNKHFIALIIHVLGSTTPTYFSGTIENGEYQWAAGFPTDWLARGTTADLAQVHQRNGQFPSNMFDSECTWCLHHAEFADYLILACSTVIAHEIAGNSEVELFYL
ncbi:hypothetical protein QMK33_21600 [Hymenobacter sp. H14-R3]|uniref:hypothetical protein n=1 Tax=Hymenobacter sp. H14-R3 TaxID=3046308 RepID=UPI0024BBD5E2|nr:hypothetical protein [Hymenobacter sp. H14-R3]MDJ0367749.1 hypothetical protein [Hymenobacter sp. H14-R3]